MLWAQHWWKQEQGGWVTGEFDSETAIEPAGQARWTAHLSAGWNIGDNSNGGYALTPVLRAMSSLTPHPDPISVTTHFLRPAAGDTEAEVNAEVIRLGRTVSTLRGSLWQHGKQRLEVMAAFSSLDFGDASGPEINEAPPQIPPPQGCVQRRMLDQGVDLPLLSRVDVCVHPDHADSGHSDQAMIDGWIRFSDGTPPSGLALPFFADALPPSLFPLLGTIGWVPTIELTVHVRRRPAPGWLQVRQESHDLYRSKMVESGTIWDSTGAVVACARQVGLLLT